MIRTWLTAATALAMMTGVAVAQTSTSTTSSQSTTATPAPMLGGSSATRTEQTTDSNGVVSDRTQTYSSGNNVTPSGDVATTHKSSETTTVR